MNMSLGGTRRGPGARSRPPALMHAIHTFNAPSALPTRIGGDAIARSRVNSISRDLPRSPTISRDPGRSPAISRDLTRSPAISRDLPRSRAIPGRWPHPLTPQPSLSTGVNLTLVISRKLARPPTIWCNLARSPTISCNLASLGWRTLVRPSPLHLHAAKPSRYALGVGHCRTLLLFSRPLVIRVKKLFNGFRRSRSRAGPEARAGATATTCGGDARLRRRPGAW